MYTLSNKTCIFVDRSEKKKKITVWCDIPNTSFGVYKKGFEMTPTHCKNDSWITFIWTYHVTIFFLIIVINVFSYDHKCWERIVQTSVFLIEILKSIRKQFQISGNGFEIFKIKLDFQIEQLEFF